VIVYRIGSRRYPANDGLGASLYGGRWNHKGTPAIYTAESVALCALEVIANDADLAGDYICISVEVPDDLSMIEAFLPPGWDSHPYIAATQDIGTNWAKGLFTAVLSVPSVDPTGAQLHPKPRSPRLLANIILCRTVHF